MTKTLFLLFVAINFQLLSAANYYIDPQNGSMNNDGTFASPWSTLDSVMQSHSALFNGGDTLFLRTGFHGNTVWVGGNPAAAITIIAQKDHEPLLLNLIIAGSNWVLDGLSFSQEGNDGVGIPGTFDNGTHLSFGANARNNVVKNCSFFSTKDASGWSVSDWRGNVWSGIFDHGKNNRIINNYLFNIAYAIQLAQECDSAVVSANLIDHFSGDGIRIGGADDCIVEYNIIKNSVELDANPQDGNHEDGIQAWDFDDGLNGLVVRGNYILNYESLDQPFRGILQGLGFFDGFYNDCIIENNIVVVEHWHGISLFGAKNCRIINNTVLPNPGGSAVAGPPWIGIFSHKDGSASTGNIVRNNLSTSLSLAPGSSSHDHNVSDAQARNFCEDYDSFNFHPKAGVSLNGKSIIDTGSPDFAPAIDFDNISRPQGAAFDIGAYEFNDSLTAIQPFSDNDPQNYNLYQNYPNPFNPVTFIPFDLNKAAAVTLSIYNVTGQQITTLMNKRLSAGSYTVSWNGTSAAGKPVASGLYFYRLKAGKRSLIGKMLYLK